MAFTDPRGEYWLTHFTDVRDVVNATALALEQPAAVNEAFNIAGPSPTRHDEGASVIAALTHLPVHTVAANGKFALSFSIDKASSLLGYHPR